MKTIILFILFPLNVFAGVGDSAGGNSKVINEILKYQKNSKFEVHIPTYKFEASHYFKIGSFCSEGDFVRSNEKIDLFETHSYREINVRRTLIETRYLRRPIYMEGRSDVILNHKIPIYKSNKVLRGRSDSIFPSRRKLYKYKYYEVPDCKDIEK